MYIVQDMNAQPEKYAQADSNIMRCGKISVDVPPDVSHIRNKQQVSSLSGTQTPLSDSWDTDFSDDAAADDDDDEDDDISKACSMASTVAANVETETLYCNAEDLENEEMYCNGIVLEQPPVPVQPPALAPKPVFTTLAHSNSHNLPKPPVPVQPPTIAPKPASTTLAHSNSHNLPKPPVPVESITSLVSTLQLPEHTDQCDEEEYESTDRVALSTLLRKTLEVRAQAVANERPVPNAQPNKQTESVPSQGRTLVETTQHVSTFPHQTNNPHAFEGHVNDGYCSEEYESISENEKPIQLPPGCGAEYYLEPVHKQQSTGGVPALPAKLWTKPAVATVPYRKPPSPPRTKSDDAQNSPGSSGDGVTGWLGGILRIRRNQSISSPQDSRERLPTSEVKKATPSPTSSHKLGPVDQRPVAFQSTQRPLPPTPGDSKLLEKPSAVGSRRILQQPWYHNVDRRQAEEMLRNGEDGSFLVRPSTQLHNSLTLTLWYKRRSYNIGIRQRSDGRCALGTEKANEQSFASVEDLIQNYQLEKLMLYSLGEKVGRTLLTTSPPQGYQHSM